MEKLIEKLFKETETLKEQYITKTLEWAEKQWGIFSSDERLGIYTSSGFYYKKNFGKTRSEDSALNRIVNTLNKGYERYIIDIKEDTIRKYESSIHKLASRIVEKGLDIDSLKMETAHIGVNIDTIITDGERTVKAFTVLAWGDIQRPHYRYLIK